MHSIPADAADVTTGWLSSALQHDFPGATATDVALEVLHDGTALTCRIRAEYADGPAGPPTFCLKAGLDAPHRELLFRTGLFTKEAMVYRDLLPTCSVRAPRCFAAALDAGSGRGYVLLEDLDLRGATFCAAEIPLTVEQVRSGLDQLAALHAARWADPEIHEPRWHHRGRSLGEIDPAEAHMLAMIPVAAATPHGGAVVQALRDPEVIGPAVSRLRSLDDASATGLIHGDAHVGNFFVEPGGGIRMADFQCVQRGHYSHDVALFVASSLDPVDRRANERALVEHHLTALERLGVHPPHADEAWLGYRRHVLYGLWAWLLTTERYQTERRLVTCVFRFGLAALDLDSLGAIHDP